MSLTGQIARNTAIQTMGKAVTTLLGVIAIAMIARYLGTHGFGQYATVVAFLQVFGVLADLGLTIITVQMISEPEADQDRILSNIFGLRLVSAAIFLGGAAAVGLVMPYEGIVRVAIAITSISFFFIALNQVLIGVFQKHLRMDLAAVSEVFGRALLVALVYVAVARDAGLLGVMWAVIAGSLVQFALNLAFSRTFTRMKIAFEASIWKAILSRSWPIAITIALNLMYFKLDTVILSLSRSQAEVGLYGAPYRVLEILAMFPFMFMGLVLPVATRAWAEKNADSFKKILTRSFDFLALAAIPLVIGTQFVADEIMVLVAGPEFAASGDILRLLIIATGVIFIGTLFSHLVVATNRQKRIIPGYAITAVIAVGAYLILIPQYGAWAAAGVTITAETLIAFITFAVVWKAAKTSPRLTVAMKALLASGIMAGVLWLIRDQHLAVQLAAAVMTYGIAILALRAVSPSELRSFIQRSSSKHA